MPYASISTQFPGGVTNAAPHQTMSEAGTPDPSWSQLYHNEFNTFAASDFTLSGAGTQQAYLLTNSGIGGVLGLVSGPNNNDNAHLFQPVGSFQLTPNKHFFFKARVAVQFNAQQPTVYVGMALNAASVPASTDGLYFFKAANSSQWVLRSIIGNVTTDTPLPAACTQSADNVFIELGFHVDPQGNVEAFFNPTTGNNQSNAVQGTYRGRVASAVGLSLTQQLVAVCAGIQNNTAANRILAIDYLTASAER